MIIIIIVIIIITFYSPRVCRKKIFSCKKYLLKAVKNGKLKKI